MIKAAVIGYGNVGRAVVEILRMSPDFALCGIVGKTSAGRQVEGLTIVDSVDKLPATDVAILTLPSRGVPEMAKKLLGKGIHTVDGFDIHEQVPALWRELSALGIKHNVAAITAAGWDPGTDSIIRTLFQAMAPVGLTYTNFGPGMSMGHTVAVRAVAGVKDALSVTIPLGTGLHRRMVYVELEGGYTYAQVAEAIKADAYFIHDETHVIQVSDVSAVKDMGHGVHMERKGSSGSTCNQLMSFDMKIDNPTLTAQVLVCSARAVLKQKPGGYTMIEIPPVDFLAMDRAQAVAELV